MATSTVLPDEQPSWLKPVMAKLNQLDCLTDMKNELTHMNKKLTSIEKELVDIKTTADTAFHVAEEAKLQAERAEKEAHEATTENKLLRQELSAMKDKLIKQEAQSRRENLLFDGIPESNNESWNDCEAKVYDCLTTNLKMSNAQEIKFERVHRIGPKVPGRPRTIIAKFSFFKDREAVWQRRTYLKSTRIWISEDYPAEIKQARRILYPIFRAAQQAKDITSSSLRLDKLTINGQQYTLNTLGRLPQSLRPENVATRREGNVTIFYSRNSIFSNFYTRTPITIDNKQFNTTEQFYQHAKAQFFGDDVTASEILKETDPLKQYQLGQKVAGYEEGKQRWLPSGKQALLKANIAKYEQHKAAKQALLATGDDVIGEASVNRTWGIGLSIRQKEAIDKSKWSGQNIMGEILMNVRELIKSV